MTEKRVHISCVHPSCRKERHPHSACHQPHAGEPEVEVSNPDEIGVGGIDVRYQWREGHEFARGTSIRRLPPARSQLCGVCRNGVGE